MAQCGVGHARTRGLLATSAVVLGAALFGGAVGGIAHVDRGLHLAVAAARPAADTACCGAWRPVEAGRARRAGRTGLGLSVVQVVAETHGGSLRLRSPTAGELVAEVRLPRTCGPARYRWSHVRRLGAVLPLALAAALAGAPAASAAPCHSAPVPSAFSSGPWHAEGLEQHEVARAPQSPSYVAWTGAWQMPDGRLMTAFTQAAGEPDPAARERADPALRERLGVQHLPDAFDFWGLRLSAEYRASSDGGRTWTPVRSDAFRAVYPHAYAGSATTALRDGTLLRRVNGWDLQHDPTVPHTAFLQRLEPGAGEWGAPEVLLDPARHTYQLSRLRRLRDGCLVATGQVWDVPAGSAHAEIRAAPAGLLLLVSADDGRTWERNPLPVPADGPTITPNEWDVAELPSGDLLAVFRTVAEPGSTQVVRRQAVLRRHEDGWGVTDVRDAPLPASGHPELLNTREGLVLHLANSGVQWTGDGGQTWQALAFHPRGGYTTHYYPVSLQTPDGLVRVFSHSGFDAGFGQADQAIVADAFRLSDQPVPDSPRASGRPEAAGGGGAPGRRPDEAGAVDLVATMLRASVRVRGRRVTVRGRLRAERPAGRLPGRVRLRFRHPRHGTRRVSLRAATRFTRTVVLRRRGRWTLRIEYRGGGRYAPARIGPAVIRLR